MSHPEQNQAGAREREEARRSWEQRGGSDEDDFDLPPPRRQRLVRPSWFLIAGACCAFLAADPTAQLGYELFGPGAAMDLGHPGAYDLGAAEGGGFARIAGYAGSIRGTFQQWGTKYELVALIGAPVVIRREPHPPIGPDTAEPVTAEGRLLRLQTRPAGLFDRLLDPAARFGGARKKFEARGLLLPGQPAWLLLDGDLPRSRAWPIAEPFLLWIASALFLLRGWHRWRHPA